MKTTRRAAVLVSLAFAFVASTASAQVNFENWIYNLDGTTTGHYTYNGGSGNLTANLSKLQYDSTYLYVSAYGVPAYTMSLPENRYPGEQSYIFRIPRNPSQQTGTKTTVLAGIAAWCVNGVPIYHPGDGLSYSNSLGQDSGAGDGIWNRLAPVAESSSLDSCLGHTSGANPGRYHVHQRAKCLMSYFGDTGSAHSPIIGWAFDGYPIYGPYGYSTANDSSSGVRRMVSSYQKRSITQRHTLSDGLGSGGTTTLTSSQYGPDVSGSFPVGWYIEDYEWITGLGDLDKYNGRTCVTPEYPSGTYAYFMTIDASGNSAYPYAVGPQFYGKTATGMPIYTSTTVTVPAGATEFQPSCAVTVTPSATSASPSTSLTASVPDTGTGSSYAWTITNGTITAGSSSRTVTFTTNSSGLTTTISCTRRKPNGCKASGSADITSSLTLSAPTNFTATLTSATSASLSWSASAGASQYVVYRRTPTSGGWVELGTSATTNLTNSSLPSNSAYVYYVIAANADRSVTSSASSASYVTTYGFTDNPVTTGTTEVKAQHITELRSAVEALDSAIGVTLPTWTDTSLSGTNIKTTHVTELRNNLNSFRTSALLSSLTFTDSTLTAQSTTVQKTHLAELRVAVRGYCTASDCK